MQIVVMPARSGMVWPSGRLGNWDPALPLTIEEAKKARAYYYWYMDREDLQASCRSVHISGAGE